MIENTQIIPELARIHSHICGDGCIYTYLQQRSPSSRRTSRSTKPFRWFIVEYTNTEPKLLEMFKNDIKTLLGNEKHVYRNKDTCKLRSKSLFLLLKELGVGKSREWRVHNMFYRSIPLIKE